MGNKSVRMKRLFPKDAKMCIIPIDHSVTVGPVEGLQNSARLIEELTDGGADAIIFHKGLLTTLEKTRNFGMSRYIMHLSASTVYGEDANAKVLVSTVEEAVRSGMDAVSVHVSLGCTQEPAMLRDFGQVACACEQWGMPLLAMVYVKEHSDVKALAHTARLAQELGADIVKIGDPGSAEAIKNITDCVSIPVLIAGGEKNGDSQQLLYRVHNAITAGASGVAVGRNIFQHSNPQAMMRIVCDLVHQNKTLDEAVSALHSSGCANG